MAPWDHTPFPLLLKKADERRRRVRWPCPVVNWYGLVIPLCLVLSFILLRWLILLFST